MTRGRQLPPVQRLTQCFVIVRAIDREPGKRPALQVLQRRLNLVALLLSFLPSKPEARGHFDTIGWGLTHKWSCVSDQLVSLREVRAQKLGGAVREPSDPCGGGDLLSGLEQHAAMPRADAHVVKVPEQWAVLCVSPSLLIDRRCVGECPASKPIQGGSEAAPDRDAFCDDLFRSCLTVASGDVRDQPRGRECDGRHDEVGDRTCPRSHSSIVGRTCSACGDRKADQGVIGHIGRACILLLSPPQTGHGDTVKVGDP